MWNWKLELQALWRRVDDRFRPYWWAFLLMAVFL